MNKVFIDSSAYIAINFNRDQFHKKAIETNKLLLEEDFEYVTTNYVILESSTSLLMKVGHTAAVKFYEDVKKSELVEIIHVSESLEEQAFQLFKKYSDKEFSLTDCVSFVVMKSFKLKKAFTNDHHFEQMGFEALIK
jgi:predicted nucleic acid-binding protein